MVIRMKQSRPVGFVVITAIYVIAILVGIALFCAFPNEHLFLRVLFGDFGATIFVFLTGVALQNASVYDPYWSVAPIVICTGVALYFDALANPGVIMLLVAVWYWGIRLTLNWAHTFKNLATQDWRYDKFKRQYPRSFQIVSFFGINVFPTTVVYLCLLPGILFIENGVLDILTIVGVAVSVGAATLQLVADIQMHRFRRENSDGRLIIRSGLWKWSRHPNYLGEVLMWWGVYIVMLSSLPEHWFLGVGPLANTLMFLFVSIPLADKRNREIRQEYDEYAKETNKLLPFRIKRRR